MTYSEEEQEECCEYCSNYYVCPMPVALCGNYRPFAGFDGTPMWEKQIAETVKETEEK